MKKDILVPVVSLLVICLVASALLGGVNMLTADRIDALAAQTVIDAQQEAIREREAKLHEKEIAVEEEKARSKQTWGEITACLWKYCSLPMKKLLHA